MVRVYTWYIPDIRALLLYVETQFFFGGCPTLCFTLPASRAPSPCLNGFPVSGELSRKDPPPPPPRAAEQCRSWCTDKIKKEKKCRISVSRQTPSSPWWTHTRIYVLQQFNFALSYLKKRKRVPGMVHVPRQLQYSRSLIILFRNSCN